MVLKFNLKYNNKFPNKKNKDKETRWGTCHTKKGIITLNSRLMDYPYECIRYVIVHEFAHFLVPNHSKNFYNVVESIMPDWNIWRKYLRNN